MILSIPIYVEDQGDKCVICALFKPQFRATGSTRARAMSRLSNELRKHIERLQREARHDALAEWSFDPPISVGMLRSRIELRKQSVKLRVLTVTFTACGRKVVYTPVIPDSWTEVAEGSSPQLLMTGVIERRLLAAEKQERRGQAVSCEAATVNRNGRLTVVHLDIKANAAQDLEVKSSDFFAMLGGRTKMRGDQELHRVGRCLDALYPADLDRAVLREDEVAELSALLLDRARPPVLLVGPPSVGKTAILHEWVYRKNDTLEAQDGRRALWSLAPQRLISGMMYVGQWEERLLAILDEVHKHDHIIYFDDLVGLFFAGRSSNSDLTIGDVLKPHLEERRIRIVGEVSPEQLRVLQERDRGFVDQFRIMRIREPDEVEAMQMMLGLVRRLERIKGVEADLTTIPFVRHLMRRIDTGHAYPGRYTRILERAAQGAGPGALTMGSVQREFEKRTGLSPWFFNGDVGTTQQRIVDALSRKVIGQSRAVRTVAAVLSTARARIGDPEKALGSFLFLGPTGVGKTQCAKAVAGYLYDTGAMLRIDMNEFVSPYAVTRLIGTSHEPDGLLTGPVRRNPMSVILLDEIEKADPGVYDLLLQVLGEGHLTDAKGRTVDFTNTILIMTSNLGVREAHARLGFDGEPDPDAFARAARRFFRPEFFNRIDHIVPFAALGDTELRRIAQLEIRQLFGRDGIIQRKVAVGITPAALDHIVILGREPELGARALRRSLEKSLTRPIAQELAQSRTDAATVIEVFVRENRLGTSVQALDEISGGIPIRSVDHAHVADLIPRIRTYVAELLERHPEHLDRLILEADQLTVGQQAYLDLRITGEYIATALDELEDMVERPGGAAPMVRLKAMVPYADSAHVFWGELCAAYDIAEFWTYVDRQARDVDLSRQGDFLGLILDRVASFRALAAGENDERTLLWVHGLTADDDAARGIATALMRIFGEVSRCGEDPPDSFELEVERLESSPYPLLLVRGSGAGELTRHEHGTHLQFFDDGSMNAVAVIARPLARDEDPKRVADELCAASPDDTLREFPPVIRIGQDDRVLDLRSGMTFDATEASNDLWRLVASQLDLPGELEEL